MRLCSALRTPLKLTELDGLIVTCWTGPTILRNLLQAVSGSDIQTNLRWTFDQTAVEPAAILQRSLDVTGVRTDATV